MPYRAPVEDYQFIFDHVVGYEQVMATRRFGDASKDVAGAILTEAVKAAGLLKEEFGVETNVWSVTSYKNLINDAPDIDRSMRLSTSVGNDPWISQCL